MRMIEERKTTRPANSYTTKLLDGGAEKIGAKISEEAAEVVEAAAEPGPPGREHLIREAADLIYHLLVMLALHDAHLSKSKPNWPAALASRAWTKKPVARRRRELTKRFFGGDTGDVAGDTGEQKAEGRRQKSATTTVVV